jgi:cell division protein FtsW
MARVRTDWILFLTIVATVCFGILMLYSASSVVAAYKYKSSFYFVEKQLLWAALALFFMMFIMKTDYRRFKSPGWAFAPVGVVMMLLIIAYFADPHAHRWLRLSSVQIQPSEFAKPALILFLAFFVSLRAPAINNWHTFIPAALLVGLLAGFVMLGDVGTAIVLLAIAAAVFFAAGLEWRKVLAAIAIGGVIVVGAVVSKPYRLARIVAFVDSDFTIVDRIDPNGKLKSYLRTSTVTRDPSYHVRQSKIAVGDGGLTGRGLMNGKQKLFYLPEAHTDFIYAVIAEELGLWGAALVVLAFLVILWRGLRLAVLTPSDFGRYVALGATTMVVVQGFFNIGVVLGMLPTKGIPLPMISYGGSSLMSTLISLGLLLSVSEHSG